MKKAKRYSQYPHGMDESPIGQWVCVDELPQKVVKKYVEEEVWPRHVKLTAKPYNGEPDQK